MSEGKIIFIIDDDPVQNDIHSIMLKKVQNDVSVHAFTSTRKAKAAIEDGCVPSIVFLDLHIPGEDKSEFLTFHKQKGLLSDIYLISSFIHHEDELLRIKYPSVKDLISKPLLTHKFQRVLNQVH